MFSTTTPSPTPTPPLSQPPSHPGAQPSFLPSAPPTQGRYQYAAKALLHTVTVDPNDAHQWAILDSGASSHFIVTNAPVTNIQPASTPVHVLIPNGDSVHSTHTCELLYDDLPQAARIAHIIPHLANHSLISLVQLCNAGCEILMSKIGLTIKYRGKTILCGHKCTRTGLWLMPMQPMSDDKRIEQPAAAVATHMAANAHTTSSKDELAMYHHQSLCSPPASTLLHAINNNQLESFPGLTAQLISKHLPPSTATDKGHMARVRQGIRSTRSNRQAVLDARAEVDDMHPTQQVCAMHDMHCFAALADTKEGVM